MRVLVKSRRPISGILTFCDRIERRGCAQDGSLCSRVKVSAPLPGSGSGSVGNLGEPVVGLVGDAAITSDKVDVRSAEPSKPLPKVRLPSTHVESENGGTGVRGMEYEIQTAAAEFDFQMGIKQEKGEGKGHLYYKGTFDLARLRAGG
jgi:hypothetical protein